MQLFHIFHFLLMWKSSIAVRNQVVRMVASVRPGNVPARHFSESYLSNHKFWIQTLSVSIKKTDNIDAVVEDLRLKVAYRISKEEITDNGTTTNDQISLPSSELGLLIVPAYRLFIPLHSCILQTQHAIVLSEEIASQIFANSTHLISPSIDPSTSLHDVIACGFSPRAQHVVVAPTEEERPVLEECLVALTIALAQATDVTPTDLYAEEYTGTPPGRIFRSFVSPRANAKIISEPVERAAKRSAQQIELALRQLRADQDEYLRNTDRSLTLQRSGQRITHPMVLVLDNIRSAFNVGSMFRTAETAGVMEVITAGITCHPPHPKLKKTAFSAVETVPSRHFDDILTAIQTLKQEGYTIVVMETTTRSQKYTSISYHQPVAIVVGNEVTGVDARVMDQADIIAGIPTLA